MPTKYISKTAEISDCGRFRYLLTRTWDESLMPCAFIGLNPSKADATRDDPTIKRCVTFAARWGYGSLLMLNIIPYRATKPGDMFDWMLNATSPELQAMIGANLATMERVSPRCGIVIAAWGSHGTGIDRESVLEIFRGRLWCLSLTKGGEPGHPLYLKGDLKPMEYGLALEGDNG